MPLEPKNIQLIGEELAIQWSDGVESYVPLDNCAAPVRVQRVEASRTCLETLRGPMLATVTRVSC